MIFSVYNNGRRKTGRKNRGKQMKKVKEGKDKRKG